MLILLIFVLLYVYALTGVLVWNKFFRNIPTNGLEARVKQLEEQIQALVFK
jgi:hypothetical protein